MPSRLFLVKYVGVASLALLLAACAEERPPVNRVQASALDKSFFVGPDLQDQSDNPEFWSQATLVDVGFGATQDGLFTSTYAQPVSRIKWQITEDFLFARLAYERVENTDGKGVGKKTDEGVIVAAFPIEKHFDIANDYNSTTGEQLNVIEENDTDRPWYQRQYMRVDFSKNLNTDSYDFDTLSALGIWGGVTYEPLSYYVDDPTDPDAPHFDLEDTYFDITVKAFAKPQTIDISALGWGIDEFPACYLEPDFFSGTYPEGSCSPVELTVRHSFRKVVDDDFEPIDWDGFRFQAFGGFYLERFGYTRNYGMSDQLWHRFLTHYNLWERSHFYENPEKMEGPVECYTPDTTPYGADPHRDENGDGTEDECAKAGAGSRCDMFNQKCTLPYRKRTPKPVVWYYAEGGNPEFFEATALATHEWDVAFRSAVRVAQYTECMRVSDSDCAKRFPVWFGQQDDNEDAVKLALEVDDCRNGLTHKDLKGDKKKCEALADSVGKKRGYSAGVIATAKMDEMLVLCHSPVLSSDPPVCGAGRLPDGWTQDDCDQAEQDLEAQGEEPDEALQAKVDQCRNAIRARRGDLRYNQINVITEPQSGSPWGIYTDSEDPLTGAKIATSVNVWSDVNDMWSQKTIDTIRYINGELTTEEVTDGEYVDDFAQLVAAAGQRGVLPRMTREQLNQRVSEFTRGQAIDDEAQHQAFSAAHPEDVKTAHRLRKEFSGVRAYAKAPSVMAPKYEARRLAVVGTPVEAALINPQMQQLYGIEGMPMTQGLLDLVSPLRGGSPAFQRQLRQLKDTALAERGVCIMREAAAPLDVAALGDILEQKFGSFNPDDPKDKQYERAEKMRKYLARRVHMGVIVHEMGHSIGMRHNFVGSADAWFYRPQYWQLRTKDGTVTKECKDLSDTGEDCFGPRFFDPLTPDESAGLIQMFSQETVMDYPGEGTQDTLGLGPYDFAAARVFYGDAVAVYADETFDADTPRGGTVLDKIDNFGGILGISHEYKGNLIHYSALQKSFDLIKDCKEVKNTDDFIPARYDEKTSGKFHPVFDGLIVKVNGKYTRCRQQPVDYVPWTTMRSPTGSEYDGWNPADRSVDQLGRTRVPYGFATDSWVDLGNASVYTHDNGADTYEIFDFLITQQEVYHIFDNYRRGRQDFSIRGAVARTLDRYNTKIRDGAKGLTLYKNWYEDIALAAGLDFDGYWPWLAAEAFRDNIIASALAFDHFTHLASRPEAGPHYLLEGDPVLRSVVDSVADYNVVPVVVPNGATGRFGNVSPAGRPLESRLADDMGEYNTEITVNAGSYFDKIYTAMLLTESVDNYISAARDDFVDARYRATSLADLFPEGYRRFLGNLLTGDDFLKGPRIAADKNGIPSVTKPDSFPSLGIGWTSWWGEKPTACFPASGTTVCGAYAADSGPFDPNVPPYVAVLDPQQGWEVQKFFIAWTLLYLPENQKQYWLDMLRVWELGEDADPGIESRIEMHFPNGKVFVARTFGRETVFGKTVEKGIAARILQYENELLAAAYETTDGPDLNGDKKPDWYIPKLNPKTGQPIVRWDPTIWGAEGDYVYPEGMEGCDADDNSKCTCADNRACIELERHQEIPFFLRQALHAYGLPDPEMKGLYD